MTADTLVLSSGGAHGFAHLGALSYLDVHGHLGGIRTYVGVSIGAVVAVLLAAGMSIGAITRDFFETDPSSLQNPRVFNLIFFGLDDGSRTMRKLQSILAALDVPPECTLRQMHERTGKNLAVGAVDVDAREFVLMDHITHPDVPVLSCLRASISVPFAFTPLRIGNRLFVDGALMDAAPMARVQLRYPGCRMLAVRLTSARADPDRSKPVAFGSLAEYSFRVIECLTEASMRQSPFVDVNDTSRVISVPVPSSIPWYAPPSDQQKKDMFTLGYEAAEGVFPRVDDRTPPNPVQDEALTISPD
jgi:predicted acylesterase/phospholipase RssA